MSDISFYSLLFWHCYTQNASTDSKVWRAKLGLTRRDIRCWEQQDWPDLQKRRHIAHILGIDPTRLETEQDIPANVDDPYYMDTSIEDMLTRAACQQNQQVYALAPRRYKNIAIHDFPWKIIVPIAKALRIPERRFIHYGEIEINRFQNGVGDRRTEERNILLHQACLQKGRFLFYVLYDLGYIGEKSHQKDGNASPNERGVFSVKYNAVNTHCRGKILQEIADELGVEKSLLLPHGSPEKLDRNRQPHILSKNHEDAALELVKNEESFGADIYRFCENNIKKLELLSHACGLPVLAFRYFRVSGMNPPDKILESVAKCINRTDKETASAIIEKYSGINKERAKRDTLSRRIAAIAVTQGISAREMLAGVTDFVVPKDATAKDNPKEQPQVLRWKIRNHATERLIQKLAIQTNIPVLLFITTQMFHTMIDMENDREDYVDFVFSCLLAGWHPSIVYRRILYHPQAEGKTLQSYRKKALSPRRQQKLLAELTQFLAENADPKGEKWLNSPIL